MVSNSELSVNEDSRHLLSRPTTPIKPLIPNIHVDGTELLDFPEIKASSPLHSLHSLPSAPHSPKESAEEVPENSQPTIAAIPILFKEAMLDTPTFRAHCEHMHKQFLEIDDWIQGLIARNNEIDNALTPLRHSVNGVIEMFMPSFIYNNALDQSNLSVVFEHYAEGVSLHWTSVIFEARKHISHITNSYKSFHLGQVARYDVARNKLLQQQNLFDKATAEYYALNRKTDAETLRDAAQQVYKFRLRYLKQSLLFCEVLVEHQKKLNNFIVEALARPLHPDVPTFIPAQKRAEIGSIMTRATAYTRSQYTDIPSSPISLKKIRSDMLQDGKKRIPSRLSMDYDAAPAIWFDQPNMFADTNSIKEKYGWIMLKLPQGSRNSKAQWVRVWLFVKGGIMGWLSLSESKSYVQESQILAVPLFEVKDAPHEDRNFCFTIATARIVFTLQAGNRSELKNWLSVIQTARKEFHGQPSSKYAASPLWANDVSCRYANKILEVNGVSPPKPSDQELAQQVSKRVDSCIDSVSSDFNLVDRTGLLGSEVHANLTPSLLQQKPLATTRSLEAFIASSYISPSAVPNAIIGNYGGSVNWSLYSDALPRLPPSQELELANVGKETHKPYPSFYPKNLQFHDIDMRSYFGPRIPHEAEEDLAVLVVRASIKVPSSSYMPVTIYITGKNMFIISASSGFTGLCDIPLRKLLVVQCETAADCDTVKITYSIESDFKEVDLKFYMDSGRLFQRRVQLLLDNSKLAQPLKLERIISSLEEVGHEHRAEMEQKSQVYSPSPSSLNCPRSMFPEAEPHHEAVADLVANDSLLQSPSQNEYQGFSNLKLVKDVNLQISPKQLFQLIFGDESPIFGKSAKNKEELKWFYSDAKIQRMFTIDMEKLLLFGGDSDSNEGIDVTQCLERRDENYFYSVEENISEYNLYSASFKLHTKYVIALARQSTRLMIYVGIVWPRESGSHRQAVLDKIFRETCEKRPTILVQRVEKHIEDLKKNALSPRNYDMSNYGRIRITAARTEKQVSDRKKHHVSSGKLLRLVLVSYSTVLWWKFRKLAKRTTHSLFRAGSTHLWLVFVVCASLLMNLYFIYLSGTDMWHSYFLVRSTERYISALKLSPEAIIGNKAVLSKDVEAMVQHARDFPEIADENNTCWQSFKRLALNHPPNDHFGAGTLDIESQKLVDNIFKKRHDIGMKRSELLSELWKLERTELELVRLEWKRWVLNEVRNCAEARQFVALTEKTGIEVALIDYCLPCIEAANLLL